MNISQQIKNNSLALVSLLVAFSALAYNTWRNEASEENRNIRTSGFEILVHVAELQKIIYITHYDRNQNELNPRTGQTEVLLIRDLSRLMPMNIQKKSEQLTTAWNENWQTLGKDNELSVATIDTALHELRMDILDVMKMLD